MSNEVACPPTTIYLDIITMDIFCDCVVHRLAVERTTGSQNIVLLRPNRTSHRFSADTASNFLSIYGDLGDLSEESILGISSGFVVKVQ